MIKNASCFSLVIFKRLSQLFCKNIFILNCRLLVVYIGFFLCYVIIRLQDENSEQSSSPKNHPMSVGWFYFSLLRSQLIFIAIKEQFHILIT